MTRFALILALAPVVAAPVVAADAPPATAPAPEKEKPAPGYMGLSAAPIEPSERADYGLAPDQQGLVILGVAPDGPSAKAGLKDGDILLAIDGKAFETPEELTALVRSLPAGKTVKASILRDEKPQDVSVTLGSAPARKVAADGDEEKEMRRQQEAMLAMMPPEIRAKIQEMQKIAEKKAKELTEKYKADGLSDEQIQERLQTELMQDAEIQKLQQELQEMMQGMGGGMGPGPGGR